ncbi:outer membrane beta-barrel family protein [Anditalea andensis]|uniref:TonB-dependent receptor n=1 Tax=Anditalea andensis TaxID=1048983 RepID=A0A074L759_9BACT|nr:outer membrane beta-barrel family protein [Anditalea andensis]KEO75663.1 TonB-dependent receptor [Anditalea andensis]
MKSMKILFFILAVLLPIGIISGQGIPPAKSYQLTGDIIDSATGAGIPYAQVAVFKPGKEQPEAFTDTGDNGRFEMMVPYGSYSVRIYIIGYSSKIINEVELSQNTNLGKIPLEGEGRDLQEVVVQTSRLPFRSDAEGIIISPDQNLSNIGGTLLDILRNTPSISVSEDGTISLRGSSATNILINGRNSSLTQNLDQLPASAVEQIKIINNPNARFDAEAEGGVINIILKKGQDLGTNGGAEFTYGTRGRMNTGARINHRTARYNIYGGYNFRRWRDVGLRNTIREIFDDNEILNQRGVNESENTGHTFQYGGDYYFGNNILSYEGVYTTNVDDQLNTLFSQLSDSNTGMGILDYVRRNNESEDDDGLDNAVIFERTFDDPEKQLRVSASHSFRNQYKTQNIDIFRNTLMPSPENLNGMERAFTDETRNISVFQLDYITPVNENSKIETGAKATIRKFDNDYSYSRFEETRDAFIEDPGISNRFVYKDYIYAAYFLFSRTAEKFDYTIGLRGEHTVLDTYLANTQTVNKQQYINLFPSLQALYKINEQNDIKFSFSRRIDRPTAWRLNPFPDITDSLNVRRGNPNLQPEMIYSFELGHLLNLERSSYTTNLFYRYVDGQLDFITLIEEGISYSQPANLNSAISYGVEFIGLAQFTPWWTLSGGATVFRIYVDGSNLGEEFVNDGFACNTKVTNDIKLPWDMNIQLVGNYESAEIEAQGRDYSQYYLDVNFQKGFWAGRTSLSLSVRDIFDTRRFAGFSLTNSFMQEFYSKNETRFVLVSGKYNF